MFDVQEVLEPGPQLDLAFKEGQTIKVNINIPKSDKTKTRSKSGGLGGGLLPPPPAGTIKPPPGAVATNSNTLVGHSLWCHGYMILYVIMLYVRFLALPTSPLSPLRWSRNL